MSYECDRVFIPAHHQLSILVDLATSHNVDHHTLLRGSGLFLEDILSGNKLISPLQFHWVLRNAQHAFQQPEIGFLFGERSLITPFNAAIKAILYAKTLRQALNSYIEFSALVSPWLNPKMVVSPDTLYLYWLDENSQKNQLLIEVCMSAIQTLTRHLFVQKLPWRYEFNYAEPDYLEQYWAHLGSDLSFERAMNCMCLPEAYLDMVLPQHALTLSTISQMQAQHDLHYNDLKHSFLNDLYDFLMQNIQTPIQLESTAEYFHMSPATFKRRLKKHDTHFQAQVDQARLHTAMMLYRVHGFKTEQIAQYLMIHDSTNFRRAFKRWCGLTPQSV
ncbi:MAG: AraC family transcriptional regulator ligand-binding domain-containing protein [Acinetobacter sp.]